jgi:hypothetical protein
MLERAMDPKKKRNLKPMKGNRFLALQTDDLSQLARDINIDVENNNEASFLNELLKADQGRYEDFVAQNPESVLPVHLDVDQVLCAEPLEGQAADTTIFPTVSIKEPESSVLWMEAVRKGRNRSKNLSRKEKNSDNDRCFLEH